MKNHNYLALICLSLLLVQTGDLSARSWRFSRTSKMSGADIDGIVSREAHRYRVDLGNRFYRDLIDAAAANDQRIMYYADDPARGGRIYPTNVLSAASAVSMVVNGETAQVTRILRNMLYYSN